VPHAFVALGAADTAVGVLCTAEVAWGEGCHGDGAVEAVEGVALGTRCGVADAAVLPGNIAEEAGVVADVGAVGTGTAEIVVVAEDLVAVAGVGAGEDNIR
jgi:hypothetical protein